MLTPAHLVRIHVDEMGSNSSHLITINRVPAYSGFGCYLTASHTQKIRRGRGKNQRLAAK